MVRLEWEAAYLQVAGVCPRPDDESDPALGVLPGAAHQAARRIVQYGAHLDVHVPAPRYK